MRQLLFNHHNHSHYCDGSSAPELYIREAIRQGFHTLGFSSHAPVPFENKFAIRDESMMLAYAAEIVELKEKYRNELNIYLSLEVDHIPGITRDFSYFRNLIKPDYIIGGVHLVKNHQKDGLWFIDGSLQEIYDKGLHDCFDDDIKAGVTMYWQQIRDMVETQNPDIIAHLDKIKMHNKNRFFTEDESWYVDQLEQTLELILRKNIIVEVNTRGIYKGRSDELFPGNKALQKIYDLGIPITLNSDAHKPEELSGYFDEARQILKRIGFRYLKLYTDGGWEDVPV